MAINILSRPTELYWILVNFKNVLRLINFTVFKWQATEFVLSLTVSLWWYGQYADTGSAGAVAEYRNAVRVATERSDVELYPAQSLDLVPESVVADEGRVGRWEKTCVKGAITS